jgi:hypothetical protein
VRMKRKWSIWRHGWGAGEGPRLKPILFAVDFRGMNAPAPSEKADSLAGMTDRKARATAKTEGVGAPAFVPPTFPKAGKMGHPNLWLVRKKRTVGARTCGWGEEKRRVGHLTDGFQGCRNGPDRCGTLVGRGVNTFSICS